MRKLLNTLYVLSEDSFLSLDGENVVVTSSENGNKRFPLHLFESIISFSYKGATPELMGPAVPTEFFLSFFTPYGKYLASVSDGISGNVLLRRKQYRMADVVPASLPAARNMIQAKVINCRGVVDRILRDHPNDVSQERLRTVKSKLRESQTLIQEVQTMEGLRGIEGKAAKLYFDVFDDLIVNKNSTFQFSGRSRRPPLDEVNALLSFGYSLLTHDCTAALRSVGLDPYVGFLHTDRPGRVSLSLDLMEEFRPIAVDRLVLNLINKGEIQPEHFERQIDGAVFLNEKGRKVFLTRWQERKKTVVEHPVLNEKLELGLCIFVQALLLAKFIRGEFKVYPSFIKLV